MLLRAWMAVLTLAAAASGGVVKIDVVARADAPHEYESVEAKAYFAVDPNAPANRIVNDLHLAPRNGAGQVEFSSDLYVLKPRDPAKGNGVVLFEVSNRGGRGMLRGFGEAFLMERGFTLVWLGWQADVPRKPELLRLYAPVARDGEKPVFGLVRAEYITDKRVTVAPLADRNHIPYAVADLRDPSAQLTVRERVDAPRRVIPRKDWQFPDPEHFEIPAGLQPGMIYDVVYRAKDPVVAGLGPAAIRDLISFLKHGGVETLLGDQRRYIKHALAYGVSQSGRFLRTFLYYGFNADEKGRRVFDGVLAHVAGAGLGSFNHRFAQPSRDGHPHLNTLYPTDIFPFTGDVQTDPETRLTDGLLVRAAQQKVVPKIFQTNGSYEYWGRAASLIHTSIDGRRDLHPGNHERIYLLAGTQHGAGTFPPKRDGTQNLRNSNDYRWTMRALLAAFVDWVKSDKQPPASRYPRMDREELVPLRELKFPAVRGVAVPSRPQRAWRADYGPEFRAAGIVTREPPALGSAFPVLVPQVGGDGNEVAGIRQLELHVPLGTFTGWNLRTREIGAAEELYSMAGSFLPFAMTRRQREAAGDPRPSIEERYAGEADYMSKAEAAAKQLVKEGFLLETDVKAVLDSVREQWRYWSGR